MDTLGVERALGAIGTTFRLTRLYPASHPAVVEAIRQIEAALPGLAAVGTVEWKIGVTGLHWQGQHILPRNHQLAELASLLYARGVRAIRANPGVTTEHIAKLFGVATGGVAIDDAGLGPLVLSLSRRSLRTSAILTAPPAGGSSGGDTASVTMPPAVPLNVDRRRASAVFRPDVIPLDVEVKRAITALNAADTVAAQHAAVERLRGLAGGLLELRDMALVAEAVGALDRLLMSATDPGLAGAIGSVAEKLVDRPMVERMLARLGEPRVPPTEREALVTATGALASLSVDPVVRAYVAAPVDEREPYRAVIRRAGDRAVDGLRSALASDDPAVTVAAAELVGLTGVPGVIEMLVPLLRHESELVREAALAGLAEIGGREICRPVMPVLKDQSAGVRAAAVHAIAVGGDPAATTVLVRRLEHEEDEGVLAELLRGIGRLGAQEALEVLAKHAEPGGMLKRRSASLRAAAVEGLAQLTSAEAQGLVQLYSHDREPAVRRAAEGARR
jgi:hypothetical protein